MYVWLRDDMWVIVCWLRRKVLVACLCVCGGGMTWDVVEGWHVNHYLLTSEESPSGVPVYVWWRDDMWVSQRKVLVVCLLMCGGGVTPRHCKLCCIDELEQWITNLIFLNVNLQGWMRCPPPFFFFFLMKHILKTCNQRMSYLVLDCFCHHLPSTH